MFGKCKKCGYQAGMFNLENGICKNCRAADSITLAEESQMQYAGFWKRVGAYWIDFVILSPLMYFSIWGSNQERLFRLYYLVPGLLFGIWYNAYLVKRYGGTPGKLLLKIKITKLDGTPAGYREAFLRYSVMLGLSVLISIAHLTVALNMNDELYYSMEWMNRSKYMMENMPIWYSPINILLNLWIWSEFIVMLTNKKRRAIHDYIANTVVIRKEMPDKSLNQIAGKPGSHIKTKVL